MSVYMDVSQLEASQNKRLVEIREEVADASRNVSLAKNELRDKKNHLREMKQIFATELEEFKPFSNWTDD